MTAEQDFQERFAQVRERLEKATPGPWAWSPKEKVGGGLYRRALDGPSACIVFHEAGWHVKEKDAALIANAPADLAWALERIGELRTEIDILRTARIRRVDDLLSDLREPLTLADVRKVRDGLTLESNDYHRQAAAAKSAVESLSSTARKEDR